MLLRGETIGLDQESWRSAYTTLLSQAMERWCDWGRLDAALDTTHRLSFPSSGVSEYPHVWVAIGEQTALALKSSDFVPKKKGGHTDW